jgi:hypothetical protein
VSLWFRDYRHRFCCFVVALLTIPPTSIAPAQVLQKEASGVITGRVTMGDKPAPGVIVFLTPDQRAMPVRNLPPLKTVTDEDGHYCLTKIPVGQFRIMVYATAFVVPGETGNDDAQRAISLDEGESVSGIDFTLVRGGVITGKITGPEGHPLIAEEVTLVKLDERGRKQQFYSPNYQMRQTDDRGVYRLYGLPAGRYLVSAGRDLKEIEYRDSRLIYARVWYPDATDEAQATVIELEAGKEVTGIDLRLREAAKTYEAQGRVIDAATGKPAPGVSVGQGKLNEDGRSLHEFQFDGTLTGAQGEFRLNGLTPGKYAASAYFQGERENYSDLVRFEISEDNMTGLEIRIHRGASLSGTVVIEGATDPAALAKLPQLRLYAFTETQELSAPGSSEIRIGPQGSFRTGGLQPGKVHFSLMTYNGPKGFLLARVERDGIPQPDGIEAGAGEQINGIRVVIVYGTATVRGQVKVIDGAFPEGMRMTVWTRRLGFTEWNTFVEPVNVDARGRFTVDGLAPGEYEFSLHMIPTRLGVVAQPNKPVNKTVTITGNGKQEVTIELRLNASSQEKKQ